MKKRYSSTALLSLLLLVLFLPVLFCIVYYGTNMNYNELHKIVTLEGNRVLFLCAVIGAAVLGILYYFLKKLPYTRRSVMIFTGITFVVCVLFYGINVHISKCIAFYGGWDCGMVANSARWIYEGSDLGYGDYYTIYSNNIPITWLLYKLYSLSASFPGYPYNPEFIWIQFQCLMLSLAVFCSVLFVLQLSRNLGISVIALIFQSIFLGISPWKIIPYTDTSTIAMPVLLLFLYALFRRSKRREKYPLWFGLVFLGSLSGILKATCYVTLIAIVLVDLLWTVLEETPIQARVWKTGLKTLLAIAALCLGFLCKQGIYQSLQYEYNPDLEIGWSNYMYNGLNEETTGACSDEGLETVRSFAGSPKADRMQYEIDGILSRMQERGIGGTLRFWLHKQVMNFNDGTFSWYQEGYFQAWDYPEITDSSWKEPLRDFYWQEGAQYLWFTTISQGLWLFILLGIVAEAGFLLWTSLSMLLRKQNPGAAMSSDTLCLSTTMIVTFIGMFLFVMLFEARARYLYNTVPVFSVMAVLGYCGWYQQICAFCNKLRGRGHFSIKIAR